MFVVHVCCWQILFLSLIKVFICIFARYFYIIGSYWVSVLCFKLFNDILLTPCNLGWNTWVHFYYFYLYVIYISTAFKKIFQSLIFNSLIRVCPGKYFLVWMFLLHVWWDFWTWVHSLVLSFIEIFWSFFLTVFPFHSSEILVNLFPWLLMFQSSLKFCGFTFIVLYLIVTWGSCYFGFSLFTRLFFCRI